MTKVIDGGEPAAGEDTIVNLGVSSNDSGALQNKCDSTSIALEATDGNIQVHLGDSEA